MNAAARASAVAEAGRIRRERIKLLDHGVSFQQEDPWRDPESDDPLAPRYEGQPYPLGKQVFAAMRDTSVAEEVAAFAALAEIQVERQRDVARQFAEVARIADIHNEAARSPLTVVEPHGSLPTLQQTITELEKRTLLPIEEIRACFRQGRRSAAQQAVRVRVEEAICVMYGHYRMAHPHAGSPQYRQARDAWFGFGHVGTKGWHRRDAEVEAWAFGDVHHDGLGELDGGVLDVFSVKRTNTHDSNRGAQRRPGGKARKPQISRCLCDALQVSERTLRAIVGVSKTSSRTGVDMERDLAPSETAASFDRELRKEFGAPGSGAFSFGRGVCPGLSIPGGLGAEHH